MSTIILSTQDYWNTVEEVLPTVLKFIPTQVLFQYRLVSRHWHEIATSITQRRGVALRPDFFNVLSFIPLPLLVSTVPWSSVQLKLFRPYLRPTADIVAQIGFTLHRVSLDATLLYFPRIPNLLHDMPNLTQLHLETNYEYSSTENKTYQKHTSEANFTGNLGRVTVFSFKFHDTDEESANFAKSLITATRCPSGIKSISLELPTLMGDGRQDGFLAALPLITSFGAESVSLTVWYCGTNTAWQSLSTRSNPTITNLEIEVQDEDVLPSEDYKPLYQFLSSCNRLQKLDLIGLFNIKRGNSGEILSLISIPPLPVLQTLSLNLDHNSYNLSHHYTPCESLTSHDFPQLTSVHMSCDHKAVLKVQHLFGGLSSIGTVTTLSVNQSGGPKHWPSVFPKLSTVSIKVRTGAEVSELFENAATLQSITLRVDHGADVNVVITQGFNQSFDIFQVESLRELQVENVFNHHALNNTAALAFCLLPPINLIIDSPKCLVSQSVASILRFYHRRVEFIKI